MNALANVRLGAILAALALSASTGCANEAPAVLVLYTSAEDEAVVRAFADELDVAPVRVEVRDDPAGAVAAASGVPSVALVSDLEAGCECYRIERAEGGAVVHGDAPAGIQFGLARLLEAMGLRFYHPQRTRVPETVALPPAGDAVYGEEAAPEMAVRGLHLHTLHPTEAHFAFNEAGETELAEARRVIDWIVKNRGNFVQWWLLNSLKDDDEVSAARIAHSRALVEYAHLRGLRVGVNVQLFAGANLQRAYDLTGGGARAEEEIRENLARLDGLGFDAIQISFGEFSGEEPDRFVTLLNLTTQEAYALWPDVEVTASIHVGNSEDLRVDYMGAENLLYYFLVQFADERIVPWIHTVMYYNLFDSAGGAYLHSDFSEHRQYLYDRLREGLPVAYYPESAYWVAYDISVPNYLPVYLRSRWLDQSRIRADVEAMGLTPLLQHVTFTSGWEWGYWQTDYVTLRSHYHLPARLEDAVDELFAPMGAPGAAASGVVMEVADLQYEHLLEAELGPYMAGRDTTIDAGVDMGIIAAPDRVRFEALLAADAATRDAFATDVLAPLRALADGTEAAAARLEPSASAIDAPWLQEVEDGLAVDVQRGRFIVALYEAVILAAEGADPAPALARAEAEYEAAQLLVASRHAALWDPHAERLVARRYRNASLYQYGYLREANQLCYWERERAQVLNLLLDAGERVPACVL